MDPIRNLIGQSGIILIKSDDPFSRAISRIRSHDTQSRFTSSGFYYSTGIPGDNKISVLLYDISTSIPIPWLKKPDNILSVINESSVTEIVVHQTKDEWVKKLKSSIASVIGFGFMNLSPKNSQEKEERIRRLLKGDVDDSLGEIVKEVLFSMAGTTDQEEELIIGDLFLSPVTIESSMRNLSSNSNIDDICSADIAIINNTIRLNSHHLKKLGDILSNISTSMEHGIIPNIDIVSMIEAWNGMAIESNLEKLGIPKLGSVIHAIIGPYTNQEENYGMPIDINHPDFREIPTDELKKLLIYADSMRNSEGTVDQRFSSFQNRIVQELSKR